MKRILIFNDVSGLGNCSMATNLPVFSVLGHYAMPVPTACYSKQTGFNGYRTLKNDSTSLFSQDILAETAADAVYVGFCNDVQTMCSVKEVAKQQDAFVLVDPIMGDNGKLYPVFSKQYVEKMKELVPLANCITPNVTEACLLADIDYETLCNGSGGNVVDKCTSAFANFLCKTHCQSAVITGIDCGDTIANLVLQNDSCQTVVCHKIPVNYSGTGDLFSSVLLGKLLCGSNLIQATTAAAEFVSRSAAITECKDRRFGVEFGKILHELV